MRINANKMGKIVYPELSYKIVGILFDVYNELGAGYQEKYYQRGVAIRFRKQNLRFQEQALVKLRLDGLSIGRYHIDFVVGDRIVLELKVANRFYTRHIKQVQGYLKSKKIKLGILAIFSSSGVRYKRILNSEADE